MSAAARARSCSGTRREAGGERGGGLVHRVQSFAWASGAGQLSSPGTYCTPPILISSGGGYSSYGSADQYVKFTIWYGTSLPTSTKVFNDSDVTYYTEQTFTTAGWYQTCIINNTSGVTTNFSISEFH